MRIKSIAGHLRPYVMVTRRRTAINHAFASAVASSDIFSEAKASEEMLALGLDPSRDLDCAYCGEPAETWDHIFATVRASKFSGYGHRLGNLLPCCKPCNSRKGNKAWDIHLQTLPMDDAVRLSRKLAISNYISQYGARDCTPVSTPDHERLDTIRLQVLKLLAEGDEIAARIRAADANNIAP